MLEKTPMIIGMIDFIHLLRIEVWCAVLQSTKASLGSSRADTSYDNPTYEHIIGRINCFTNPAS